MNAIFAIRGLVANGRPTSEPKPLTILSTPGGKISWMSSATNKIPTGVCSAGLITTQLPAAKAGASFHAAIKIGKFHGII